MKGYQIGSIVESIKFLREAAGVRRSHTAIAIGEYNVGYHSYNILNMLRILHPRPSIELVWAIVEHDVPERLTGDIPAPAKWFEIIDVEKLEQVEFEIIIESYGYSAIKLLNRSERLWLASLDVFELWLWCKDQIALGNSNCQVMHDRILRFVNKNRYKIVGPVLDLFFELADDPWIMMPDLGDGNG